MTQSAIAIIAPDGNRVVGLYADMPVAELSEARYDDPRVTRVPLIDTSGDWPFRFDRISVADLSGWVSYEPDDLPIQYWGY